MKHQQPTGIKLYWAILRIFFKLLGQHITGPFLRAFGFYDAWGFKHSFRKRKRMKRAIAYLSIEEQATYAHRMMKEKAEQADYLKSSFTGLDIHNTEYYRNADAVSIGNTAYIAIHGHGKYQQKARRILQLYKEYVRSSGSTQIISITDKKKANVQSK